MRKEKEKEEECSAEGQSRLKPSSSDEMEDTPEVPQLGPPIAPAVRSNIAARSKEALLRHQVRKTYPTYHTAPHTFLLTNSHSHHLNIFFVFTASNGEETDRQT